MKAEERNGAEMIGRDFWWCIMWMSPLPVNPQKKDGIHIWVAKGEKRERNQGEQGNWQEVEKQPNDESTMYIDYEFTNLLLDGAQS